MRCAFTSVRIEWNGGWKWDETRANERDIGLIDLHAPTEVVKQIIINIEAGVEVEVTIAA